MNANCKYNLTNANYRKVIAEVKQNLGSEYNYEVFRTVADTFSGDINSLTSEYIMQHYPRKNAPQEKISQGQNSTEPTKKEKIIAVRKEAKQQRIQAERWARIASDGEGFEVSSAGDELGKQFSALTAIFPEGTTITIRVGGKRSKIEQTFEIGGYSVEAAYQMIKGYDRNPKGSLIGKNGMPLKIDGKGKAPISKILKKDFYKNNAATQQALEDFSYYTAYLPLWKLWAKSNSKLISELKSKAKNKILTDRFAKGRVSQARALSTILWGEPKTPVSPAVQERYDIQRKNAVAASRDIAVAVKKIDKLENIQLVERKGGNDQQIAYMAQGMNSKGQLTTNKSKILSFSLSPETMNSNISLHINPFEGQKDAVKKFIQWIIPDAFNSLPTELRVESEKRDTLRRYMMKGGWQKTEIIANNSPENILFAKTLRYIIDNFKELRQRYNPIDIQEFGNLKHRVKVSLDTTAKEGEENNVMLFTPLELVDTNGKTDASKAIRLEKIEKENNKSADSYLVSFPDNYNSFLNKAQKERLFKTVAKAIPAGALFTLNADIATQELLDDFNQMVDRGFEKVAEKEVTFSDGSVKTVGVYKRNGFKEAAVVTQEPYSFDDIINNYEAGKVYFLESSQEFMRKNEIAEKHWPIMAIPTMHNNSMYQDSYWSDGQFQQFKEYVDDAVRRAKKFIDDGYTVVMPKGTMGSGKAALQHYAPRLFEYLTEQLEAVKEYGNKEALAEQYFAEKVTTVEAIEDAPSENYDLNLKVLHGARAQLRQRYTDAQIHDLARLYTGAFQRVMKVESRKAIKELLGKIAKESDNTEKEKLQLKLDKLQNPSTVDIQIVRELGIPKLLDAMESNIRNLEEDVNYASKTDEQRQRIYDSFENGFRELIFNYAIPMIEETTGIRINASQNAVDEIQTQTAENDEAEDTEGEDSPEMGWSYNYRLVDPYKSLSKNVRKIINSIPMRNPNDLRTYVYDSVGEIQYWDAKYIYSCIMSRMAQLSMGEVNNFVVMIPASQLSEKEAERFPFGKPTFPILEGMKTRYSWANDLILKLQNSYKIDFNFKMAHPGMSTEEIAADPIVMTELGNTVSQLYANFCQQFVPYCTMVNGDIIAENTATGATSLRQTTVTNYEGNVRFRGINMIYNHDGSVNADNVEKLLQKVTSIFDTTSYNKTYQFKSSALGDTREFWQSVENLRKDYDSLFDAFEAAPKLLKNICKETVDALKACGIVFSTYDVFCIIMENKDPGFTEMLSELRNCLNAIKGLPANEHIFESSMILDPSGKKSKSFKNPRFHWNKFFEKFGDYVTEREYESSSRIMGKARYSYVFPSYMSMTLSNLTNPDLEARRKYIEENFMPYEWFYDKEKGVFKNYLLAQAYDGHVFGLDRSQRELFGSGHDLICKKDGYNEKDYADWSPEDIYELMLRELRQPTNAGAGCFVIPVLSDSRVCKTIQAEKLDVQRATTVMARVVLQELERMGLVEKRNIVFKMQDIQEKMDNNLEVSEKESEYYKKNLDFYTKYKQRHPEKLQEVENFDKNGSQFCFFPELNDIRVSLPYSVRNNNTFMVQVIRLLSKDINNPSNNPIDLKTILQALQNMTDSRFKARAEALQMTTRKYGNYTDENGDNQFGEYFAVTTKEDCIMRIIEEAIRDVMQDKVDDFYFTGYNRDSRMNVKEPLLNALLRSDKQLMSEYNSLPRESENRPLTPKEAEARDAFYDKVYSKVQEFYFQHTANMSQFIQLMVTDPAYYKDPSTFEGSIDFAKRWKEVYGAGMKLNTNSKYGKKIERSIILADNVRRSVSFDTLDAVLQKAVDDGRILKEEKEAVLNKMKFIKGTDAQAYRSLTSYRDVMDMIGQQSEEMAKAIDNLRNDRWSMNDFYIVFNTLKPFSFGPEEQDSGIDDIKMRTMVQHKNSEAVLLAIYSTLVGSAKSDTNYSKKLRGLNRAMEEIKLVDENGNVMKYTTGEEMKAIDLAQYHSAVKVGAHGIIDINYSRDALKKAQKDGVITVNGEVFKVNDEVFKVSNSDSYYDIKKKLDKLLDNKKITSKQYNDALDSFEPDEDEVFEIIRSSIYKNGDESLGYDDQVLHKLPYANYSVQQPTPDHYTDNDRATFGSQPRHIIMADLPEDFSITINGKKYNREEIRNRYNGLLVANLIDCYVNDIEPLFKDVDKKKPAIERLRDRLVSIIEGNPKYGKNMIDALQIVRDESGNLTFALPLNNLTIASQLEEIMTSMFKNAIHRQHINGGNVILAADIGYADSLKVVGGKRDADGNLISAEGIEGIECLLPAHMRSMFEPYMIKKTKKVGDKVVEYHILDIKKLKEAGLDKAIGYRIPTEGLYSIMPLIVKGFLPQQSGSSIVVAQEITTLTGSDNDVDKLFLMLKATKNLQVIKPKKGEQLHPLDMSKAQRDNEIIDIFYGVITHPQMSHRWLHPGNYDNIKLNAKRLKILKDRKLRKIFIERAGLMRDVTPGQNVDKVAQDRLIRYLTSDNIPQKSINELYRRVMLIPDNQELKRDMTIMDVVIDFTDKFLQPLPPVYPDTFIEMHQTYMAGVAEKGIFANNNTDHAKLQWANLEIAPSNTFNFEGREVRKIDERYIKRKKAGHDYLHYISDDCAECSAAAVDNGKDPQLKDINCTKQTAAFFGLLLRLGLGIEGASLLLAQPFIDYKIRTTGSIGTIRDLKKERKRLGDWLKENKFDLTDDRFNWKTHNFTVRELYDNLFINYKDLVSHGATNDAVERIASLYRVYGLMQNLIAINQEMQIPKNVLHYDSPNHAADITMGGVVMQTKSVEQLNERSEYSAMDRLLVGDDQLIVYNIEQKKLATKNGEKLNGSIKEQLQASSPRKKLYDALMNSELPITQAFYTLGIEKVRKEFSPYFVFGREEIQELTDRLCNLLDRRYIFNPEERAKIANQMYKDWVVYRLSKTSLFGDDASMTYDQKRQYYLYSYPAKFLQLKDSIPELGSIDAIRRMSVNKGMIVMDRSGSTTISLRDFISDSFDTLIQSDNPEVQQVAKDLFLYCYYLNGYEFSYMSFGNMMGTEFQRAFPEYIKALRDMSTEIISQADMDNFFDQFMVKRNGMGLLQAITYEDSKKKAEGLQLGYHNTGKSPDFYGGLDMVDEYVTAVSVSGNKIKTEVLRLNKYLTEMHNSIVYEPIRMNTPLHYSANQTMAEMADIVYDQDIIDANKRVGRKKKATSSVMRDSYNISKRSTAVDESRGANTSEIDTAVIPSNKISAIQNEDNASEIPYDSMERAVGSTISKDSDTEPVIDNGDAFIQSNRSVADIVANDDTEDPHIKAGQEEIKKNNNGKGLCI